MPTSLDQSDATEHGDAEARPVHTLILTAMTIECDPIVKAMGGKRYSVGAERIGAGKVAGLPLYGGTHAGVNWVAAVVGIGPKRASSMANDLIESLIPERVIIAGVAGALDRGLDIADILTPASVIDLDRSQTFKSSVQPTSHHVMVTTATPRLSLVDKQQLYEETSADAVDMETAAIARTCQSHGTAWICVRAISDRADEALPPWIMGLSRTCGKPHLLGAIRRIVTRPWQLPTLLKLGRQAKLATRALAQAVCQEIKNA